MIMFAMRQVPEVKAPQIIIILENSFFHQHYLLHIGLISLFDPSSPFPAQQVAIHGDTLRPHSESVSVQTLFLLWNTLTLFTDFTPSL